MIIIAIVVTYNGSQWIDKCFGSLINCTIPVKILAIDNASTDGTPDIIRKNFPEVEVIETGENLGFGKANNIGLKRVLDEKSDFAFLLNQDAWIEPDTINKLIDISKENPEYGILSPIHLNGKGDAIDRNFQNYLAPATTPIIISDLFLNKLTPIYTTTYVNAAAWLLTFECIKHLGGFDPLFPHYGEDDDYINRALFHNVKIGIVPDAIIYHDRKYKNWSELKWQTQRLVISNMLMLKNHEAPFRSNLLLFFKTQFDKFTSNLLFRKFKDLKYQIITFNKTIHLFKRIYKSKKHFSNNKHSIIK